MLEQNENQAVKEFSSTQMLERDAIESAVLAKYREIDA